MRPAFKIPFLVALVLSCASLTHADRLFLQPIETGTGPGSQTQDGGTPSIEVAILRPFDVLMVAERDSGTQMGTVAYMLEMSDGLILAGEELQVEAILALGRSTDGVNLAFQCVEGPRVPILRFRFLATRQLDDAEIRLVPDSRGEFLGIVTCEDEEFTMRACEPNVLRISAR